MGKRIPRREAMVCFVKIAGAAACLSAAEVEHLVAQIMSQAAPDVMKLIGIKAGSFETKALKILLMPRNRTAEVFQSEFGRPLQAKPVRDAARGFMKCEAYFEPDGQCAKLACGLNICNLLGCGVLETGQFAGFDGSCGTAGAGAYIPQCVASPPCQTKELNVIFSKFTADPFLQALLREFGLPPSERLFTQLRKIVSSRRAA
jgi:hypothetical protein